MISVVGHFGTLYSYSTVAGNIAEALRAEGMLANCQNLDERWHPRWAALSEVKGEPTHGLLVSAPNHYVDVFASMFGRDRAAIFVSPNTDALADEHAQTISLFGLVIAPSRFCANAVARQCTVDSVSVLPLGTPLVLEKSFERIERIHAEGPSTRPRVLHFTSDQAWPSRKGTETLLAAWAALCPRADLTVHGPPSLRKEALYAIADLGIDESVTYETSGRYGSSDDELSSLFASADLIVAPSRSEGYGMMIATAVDYGIPLLTTYNTGHAEFLRSYAGAWLQIPTPNAGPIAYEWGQAPLLEAETLAAALRVALMPSVRMSMIVDVASPVEPAVGSWKWASAQWVERLKEWMA